MSDPVFLKLGGSLLTDKTQPETIRADVLSRVAGEIATARQQKPGLRLILGHGSGSFGHVAAAKHGTRLGVAGPEQWTGFAAVSDAAARLNRRVVAALLSAGVPSISLQPSASAICADGQIVQLALEPVIMALSAGLVPVVYGDVAFDAVRGGTIISTEEVLAFLAHELSPSRLLLAGETTGVLDAAGRVIPLITPTTLPAVLPALGGSRGTDVTGGMITKVKQMLALVSIQPGLEIHIFSGLEPGVLSTVLSDSSLAAGTRLSST